MKNEIITGFNKGVWIPDTVKRIAEWEDFAESIFCDAEDKESARRFADELRNFLDALKSDTVTRDQYERIRLIM